MSTRLLEIHDLHIHLASRFGRVRAVDGVSLAIDAGETLGLVGESGCGKSTLGKAIVGLHRPTSGSIRLGARDATMLDRHARARIAQIVFQDPFGSLNPRSSVGRIVEEPLIVHRQGDAATRRTRVDALLASVGLPTDSRARFPHELSGGQRQRVAIARALALSPQLVVCDEPVSALDVSIQAQVLNLLVDLQARVGLAYLFISHDLAVVRHVADRIVVMYLGRVVEMGVADALWSQPAHPYTRMLLSAIPDRQTRTRQTDSAVAVKNANDELPSAIDIPSGCRFRTRCPKATGLCAEREPSLSAFQPAHTVACHHPG